MVIVVEAWMCREIFEVFVSFKRRNNSYISLVYIAVNAHFRFCSLLFSVCPCLYLCFCVIMSVSMDFFETYLTFLCGCLIELIFFMVLIPKKVLVPLRTQIFFQLYLM